MTAVEILHQFILYSNISCMSYNWSGEGGAFRGGGAGAGGGGSGGYSVCA